MKIKDCFVIMPFSASESRTENEWTEIFENILKPAWNEFDVECYRTKVHRGSITKDIIEKLFSASIVFADLTDSNPNVMYELGVRHSFKKPSVMVKVKDSTIPFDVNDYNVFEYENTPKGLGDLKNHIKLVIQDIDKYPNKSDNPVWDFLYTSSFIIDYYKEIETIQKLEALRDEFEGNLKKCDEFLDVIKNFKLAKDFEEFEKQEIDSTELNELQLKMETFFPLIRRDALTHLLIAQYINFTNEDRKIFKDIDEFYRWCYFYTTNLASYRIDENEKQKIIRIKETIQNGVDIVNKRISDLELKSNLDI